MRRLPRSSVTNQPPARFMLELLLLLLLLLLDLWSFELSKNKLVNER